MNDTIDVRIGDAEHSIDGAEDVPESGHASPPSANLWGGDTGILGEASRRALVQLIKGPYLSGDRSPGLWAALLADQRAITIRLHELFLDLVIDPLAEFAFVRNASTGEFAAPSTVRTQALTFIDSAMLLVLRDLLLRRESEGRVIVGREEVFERLSVYRGVDRDESDFAKRLNSAWLKMREKLRVVHRTGRADDPEDRVEISPVLRLILDADQVRAVTAEYARLVGTTARDTAGTDEADDDAGDDAAGRDAASEDDAGEGIL
ncbi:DUF4194 domain-containing protein [Rathayibacter sp. CAU 1779]